MNNITSNINYDKYSRLMSPEIKNGDKTVRQVQLVKYPLNYLTTLFYRFVNLITTKEHKWENNKALFTKFETQIASLRAIEKNEYEKFEKLANDLISRNPSSDSKTINEKLTHLNKVKVSKSPLKTQEGKEIGVKDTVTKEWRRILLNPTLEEKLLHQYQGEEKELDGQARRKEITATLNAYRGKIKDINEINELLKSGRLQATTHGAGGAYFLQDENHKTIFVLKPHGEGTYCIDNRKCEINEDGNIEHYSTIFNNGNVRIRKSIPLYCEVLSEVLYYQVSELLGLNEYVPETFWTIIKSKEFFNRSEDPDNRIEKEKLCSTQRFMKNQGRVVDLSDDKNNPLHFDKIDAFSVAVSIFLDDLCGNTDRFGDNCLIDTIKRLINIDNGLCFPENNKEIRICNVLFPQAKEKFPKKIIDLINEISDEKSALRKSLFKLIGEAHEMHEKVALPRGSKNASKVMSALEARIKMMKWAIDKDMTMREVGLRVIALAQGDKAAYRETAITKDNVDPFQIGIDGNKSWKRLTIPTEKKSMAPHIVEIPLASEDDSDDDFALNGIEGNTCDQIEESEDDFGLNGIDGNTCDQRPESEDSFGLTGMEVDTFNQEQGSNSNVTANDLLNGVGFDG